MTRMSAPQETANILVHRFLQPKNAEPRKIGAASRALASAKLLMKSVASLLHLPPVSMATTTSRHRSLTRSS